MVNKDLTQSTFSDGIWKGFQRSWLGVTMLWLKSEVRFSAGKFNGSVKYEEVYSKLTSTQHMRKERAFFSFLSSMIITQIISRQGWWLTERLVGYRGLDAIQPGSCLLPVHESRWHNNEWTYILVLTYYPVSKNIPVVVLVPVFDGCYFKVPRNSNAITSMWSLKQFSNGNNYIKVVWI